MTRKYFDNMPTIDRSAIKGSLTGFAQSRLMNLYNKIYTGASMMGENISVGDDVQINYGLLGDSVAGFKGYPLKEMLIKTFGKRGDMFKSTPSVTGDAYIHSNVSECEYWFNGQWTGILNGNGSITYNLSGGAIAGDTIKIYYIKKAGFGAFKVQESTTGFGGTYSDISGYTNIDCSSASENGEAAVLTITVADAGHNVRIVGVSGEVAIISVSCQYVNGAGVLWWDMSAGGLGWGNAINCPSEIITPVFADLELDLISWEAKEGDSSSIVDYVYPFFDIINTAFSKTDFVLIGSSPQSTIDDYNISANAALKAYADDNDKYFFDAYSPLINYERLVELGWEGDGTHLDRITGFYIFNIMAKDMGLDVIFFRKIYSDIKNDSTETDLLTINKSGNSVYTIESDVFGFDVIFKVNRNYVWKKTDGSTNGAIIDGGGNIISYGKFYAGGSAGVSGTFTTTDGKTITITNGIVTSIV